MPGSVNQYCTFAQTPFGMFTKKTTLCVGSFSNPPKQDCAGELIQDRVWNADIGYRYGFNSQERDNEISGMGNSYTAEFWQYDSRLIRRWNLDPKPNPSISDYSCFANNPICYKDLLGDSVKYGGIRDRVNVFNARVFDKNFRADYVSKRNDNSNTYTYVGANGSPRLKNLGRTVPVMDNSGAVPIAVPGQFNVLYGNSITVNLNLNINWTWTSQERISSTQAVGSTRIHRIRVAPGTPIILKGKAHPTQFTVIQQGVNILPTQIIYLDKDPNNGPTAPRGFGGITFGNANTNSLPIGSAWVNVIVNSPRLIRNNGNQAGYTNDTYEITYTKLRGIRFNWNFNLTFRIFYGKIFLNFIGSYKDNFCRPVPK